MAVFTAVTEQTLSDWLAQHYDLGPVVAFRGIPSGIENSNFFVTTERDGRQTELVLTLFERLSFEQLPFYLHLMEHLAARDVPVPAPLAGRDGQILRPLNGKPATLVSKLPGRSALAPDADHCRQVGAMLARMHLAGRDYPRQQPNLRTLPWWEQTVPVVEPFLNPEQSRLIRGELAAQQAFFASADYAAMPSGPCHCDLFRDNVLFDETADGDRLGGFFDFYFAGCDKWLFDVAVTVNDWCIDLATGELDEARALAMVQAYAEVRPFTPEESRHWRLMLRAGALRFWVSRLWDFYLPRDAQMLKPHDPTHFERVLLARIEAPAIPWIAGPGEQ